ncbi:MAG: DUF896 domain-containing protein [Clostridiales bacterium]|nr:DUF896 domain-containing protein [Clostridiales bacterium]MDD7034745.1 DUF896 domain-containing protein [Bacillota bacterium]MDY2919791.1 DUF896 domain-containing protein [Lentihominibacter sp.]
MAQITKDMIDRINQLAHKKKNGGLTPAEQKEQKALYIEYLAAIRGQVRSSLDNVRFVEDLTEEELKEELENRTK